MNFSSESKKLSFCETVLETTAEQSLEADITLPDYCPEIRKILKCSVCPQIISVQSSSGRITAQGNALVKIIYVGDNDKTVSFEQSYPVQKSVDSDSLNADSNAEVRINVDYVNSRAVSARRIDIRAMLTFVFKSEKKGEETVLCSADGCGIQCRNSEHTYANLSGLCTKAFNLTEVIEISSDKNPVSQIVNASAFAVAKDIKIINNKILIKGDCEIKIHYLSENKDSIDCVEHSIPISQIIEVDGVTEDCISSLCLKVTSCETVGKVDSSGGMRLIDIAVRVCACFASYNEISLNLISDAYSTSNELKNTFKSLEINSLNTSFDTTFINKVVIESIGVSVESILGVWCDDIKYTSALKGDSCVINGTYRATVIYRDADKQTGVIHKPVDFEYSFNLKKPASRINSRVSLQIAACSCSLSGESKLEIKTEISACGIILSNEIVKYISDIDVLDECTNSENACALTIYFSDENEKVWNIAKKYKTTVNAIMQENDLDSETIETRRFLLIPAV